MTTDNQGAIFIADFAGKCIREKVMMEKPHPNDYDGHKGYYLDDMEDYTAHVNSRRTFPYPVSKEQDGKEIPESEFYISCENWPDKVCGCYIERNNPKLHPCTNLKQVAIPIDNIGETDHGYEEGLPDQKEGKTEYGHKTKELRIVKGYEYLITEKDWSIMYLRVEYDHQIEKMKKIGIPVEEQFFEQCVNSLIWLCEMNGISWDKPCIPLSEPSSKEQEGPDIDFARWTNIDYRWIPSRSHWLGPYGDTYTDEQLYQFYLKNKNL